MAQTVLDLKAVEAMCNCGPLVGLMATRNRREFLEGFADFHPDDWMIAGMNCTDDADILPVAIHTFLMDWREQ